MPSHISEIIPVNDVSPFTEQEPLRRFVDLPPRAQIVGAVSVYSALSDRPDATDISYAIMRPAEDGAHQRTVTGSLLDGYDALIGSQAEVSDPTLEEFGDQALCYASEMMGEDKRHLLSGLVAFETTDEKTEVHRLQTIPFFSRTAELFIIAKARRIEAEPPLSYGRPITPELSAQLRAQSAQLRAQYELMFSRKDGELRREKVAEITQQLNASHLVTVVAKLGQLPVQSEAATASVAREQTVQLRGRLQPAVAM